MLPIHHRILSALRNVGILGFESGFRAKSKKSLKSRLSCCSETAIEMIPALSSLFFSYPLVSGCFFLLISFNTYHFSVNLVQCSSMLHMTDHLAVISVLFLTSLHFHEVSICIYKRHALSHFHRVISSFIRFSLFWYAFTCFPFEESATLVDWRSSS